MSPVGPLLDLVSHEQSRPASPSRPKKVTSTCGWPDPPGHLPCEGADEALEIDVSLSGRLRAAFAQGSGPGLLQLGAREVGRSLPPAFVW
jgi:hypothetical protein